MSNHYYTVGMAGHIDHGKTSLTKALTNVDTDRLKEEKERQISIELGFAPLELGDDISASVIDVPGHERFIRQMIAGVAGIDLVILVVAADEGVMPQTKEHLDILSFLGIKKGIVAITKIDKVDSEFLDLVQEEISEQLKETVFAYSPIVMVDSLKSLGIDQLKEKIKEELLQTEKRNAQGAFRLPIDQVFTVKGQGTVVRGTVYEGTVFEGQSLLILPNRKETKARQMQVHHQPATKALAGQRVAINLSNITKDDIERGDVIVDKEHFIVTDTIDISLSFIQSLKHPLKQRSPIKLHLGTSEVMGRIVFFDRNEVTGEAGDVLCQLRLDEEVVTKRGDRFILRRPTPQETLGGGWVIDPNGGKYRFSEETIDMLYKKKEGSPTQRIIDHLKVKKYLRKKELLQLTSIKEEQIEEVLGENKEIIEVMHGFTLISEQQNLLAKTQDILESFHLKHSLRFGMNKAELISLLSQTAPKEWVAYVIDRAMEDGQFKKHEQFISNSTFKPTYPTNWLKRIEQMLEKLEEDQLQVKPWDEYGIESGIPADVLEELKHFLLQTCKLYSLDDKYFVTIKTLQSTIKLLRERTSEKFDLKQAKEILDTSRKYLIPLLELLDQLEVTKREEQDRVWVRDSFE
jgi:selenocysteine-specific elongation factor